MNKCILQLIILLMVGWNLPTVAQAALPSAFSKQSPANGATNQPVHVTLSWGASVGATRYAYCIATTNACPGQDSGYISTNATSIATNLYPNIQYYWQVRAYNSSGQMTPANGTGGWWSFTTMGKTVSNTVVSLGISGQRGGAIDSLRVAGTEVLDIKDLGRMTQASLTFTGAVHTYQCPSMPTTTGTSHIVNPQEGGDICGNPSTVYGLNTVGTTEINVGTLPRDYAMRGFVPDGLKIEGNHKIGPLPYANYPEAIRLGYHIFATTGDLSTQHQVPFGVSNGKNTYQPLPYLPAMYFKASELKRLFGLRKDGTWVEVTALVQNVADHPPTNSFYNPLFFKFLAMAWMREDLGWGVGLYSYRTIDQPCVYDNPTPRETYIYPVAAADPAFSPNSCPNFEALMLPRENINNLSSLDQSLPVIKGGGSEWRMAHLAVGNLTTIQTIIMQIYKSKN